MDLMFKHKKGGNKTKTYTAFMVIQQATKSGTFKGDASIEFDTTGMLYVVNDDEETNRYIMFSKNRRGDNRVKLYYRLYQGKMRYIPRIVVAPIINETIVSDNGHRTFRHSFIN